MWEQITNCVDGLREKIIHLYSGKNKLHILIAYRHQNGNMQIENGRTMNKSETCAEAYKFHKRELKSLVYEIFEWTVWVWKKFFLPFFPILCAPLAQSTTHSFQSCFRKTKIVDQLFFSQPYKVNSSCFWEVFAWIRNKYSFGTAPHAKVWSQLFLV